MTNHRPSTSLPEAVPTNSYPEQAQTDRCFLVDGARVTRVPGVELGPPQSVQPGAVPVGAVPSGATVVLLHGAGSGTDVGVLRLLAERLVSAGVAVAKIEMPYRVAGRRAPDRPARLDAVLKASAAVLGGAGPLALAGRSMGSRVACRCAKDIGAKGVLALGFPLNPPGGRAPRLPELLGAGVEVLVVQGERDAFGMPEPDPSRGIIVHVVRGADHMLRRRAADPLTTAAAEAEAADVGARWLLSRLLSRPSDDAPARSN